jgi:hypothetical protein
MVKVLEDWEQSSSCQSALCSASEGKKLCRLLPSKPPGNSSGAVIDLNQYFARGSIGEKTGLRFDAVNFNVYDNIDKRKYKIQRCSSTALRVSRGRP